MTQVFAITAISLVTFAAIMLFYHHHIQGWVTSQRRKFLILGVMLGMGASMLMLYPVELTPDVTFQNRPIFVGFAGLLGGWIGAGSALILAVATRMAISGPDMSTGILVLSVAAGLGVLGHIFLSRTRLRSPWSWAILGGLLSLFLSLTWILALPDPVRAPLLRNTVLILSIASVIGAVGAGYLISSVRDVVNHRQRAMTQSRTDDLTGVLNRRGLNMAYQSVLFRGREAGVALLTIDLDRFKLVNDNFGHVVGDRLLKLIADQINQLVRKDDIVARMGGDEFVVVLANTTKQEAENTAERLCRAINESQMIPETARLLHDAYGMISASIGVAFTQTPPERLEELLEASDRLLYDAKRNGRGQSVVADVASLDKYPPPHRL